MVVSSATLLEYDCSWCRSTVSCLCAILGPMSEAAMSSFTWKRPRDLETQQGRETPQDLETRYEGADIEPASLAAWRLLMEQLISSADPAIPFIGFLQTMHTRELCRNRVYSSPIAWPTCPVPSASLGWRAERPGSNTGSTCTTPCCVLPARPFRPDVRSMPSPSPPSSRWHC